MIDPRLAELRETFRKCDVNCDGLIDVDEFIHLIRNLEWQISDREARIGFQEIDADNDQRIDFQEFAEWWRES